MNKYSLLLAICFVLLLSSCGQQYKAKSLVNDFMEANVKDFSVINEKNFGKIDSSSFISDSMVMDMRKKANDLKLYKNGIKYTAGKLPDVYYFIRVTYNTQSGKGKTHKNLQTFYFDKEITRIIAFK
ncbi:hypothetical protein [Xylanibacter oryzae]|uniref:hypothetical protein n=1 Tax=Xylanibacter oryzae TaxID=185293 RepID=UPI0012B58839|nr:hypothetical protein [Xylanibacter oryzae]